MGLSKVTWEGMRARVFDTEEHETTHPFNPILFEDDFLGAYTVIPAATAEESGCDWSKLLNITLGTPTVAIVGDAANGVCQVDLEATNEVMGIVLYMSDDRRFIITQGMVFETRIKVSVLPTGIAEAVWGLAGDNVAIMDNIVYSVWFSADGSGEIFCEKDDNGTDQGVTSGVTVTNTQWKVYRIDFRDVTDIKFFINGVRVASGTTFPYVATGANATLQPFFGLYKGGAGSADTGALQIDYIRIWGNRS